MISLSTPSANADNAEAVAENRMKMAVVEEAEVNFILNYLSLTLIK
jgi:hypothetical protein